MITETILVNERELAEFWAAYFQMSWVQFITVNSISTRFLTDKVVFVSLTAKSVSHFYMLGSSLGFYTRNPTLIKDYSKL